MTTQDGTIEVNHDQTIKEDDLKKEALKLHAVAAAMKQLADEASSGQQPNKFGLGFKLKM